MLILDSDTRIEYFILGAWLRGPYNIHQITRALADHSERPPLYSKPGQYELKRAVSHTIRTSRVQAKKDHSGSTWFWSEIWSPNKLADRLILRAIHHHMEYMLDSLTWLPQMPPWTPTLTPFPTVNAESMAGQSDVDGIATSSATTTGSEDFLAFYTPMSTPGKMSKTLSPSEISMADISDQFDKLDERNSNSVTRPDAAETSQHSVQGLQSSKNNLAYKTEGTIDAPFESLFPEQTQVRISEEIPPTGAGTLTAEFKNKNPELPDNPFHFPGQTIGRFNAPQNSPAATNERQGHSSCFGSFSHEVYSGPNSFWNHPLANVNPVTFSNNPLPINNEKPIANPINYQATIHTVETSKDLTGVTEEERRHAYYVKTFHGHPSKRVSVARGHSRGVPKKKKKVVTPQQRCRKNKKDEDVSLKPPEDEALGVQFSGLGEENHSKEMSETGMMKHRRRAVDGDGINTGLESTQRRLKLVRMDAILGTPEEKAHQHGISEGGVSPSQEEERGDDKPKHLYKAVEYSAVKDSGADVTAGEYATGPCVAGSVHLAEHTIGHADPNHDGESLFIHPLDIPWMGYN
ncbi:MAG: hypothetical protein LQ350_004335 [Teloschistes chrysophthalmus]|nr:MAG: hypothetical protein LQ350_004335 [Niorma chrysophthalma]